MTPNLTSNYVIYQRKNLIPAYPWKDTSIYSEIDKQYNTIRYLDQWLFRHLKRVYLYCLNPFLKNILCLKNQWLDRCTDCAEMFLYI